MKKSYIFTLLLAMVCALGVKAQVTTEPTPLQEDSQDVKIYFHADQGNKGLMGLGPTAQIYAHTGVCLSNGKDWVNAPTWGDNADKYKLTYVSDNLWELYIGDIRQYYGITDPAVNVTRLAFVFRTADKAKEGKGVGNTDIFVDVVDSGLQIALESNLASTLVTAATSKVTFKVGCTMNADLTLTVNGQTIGSKSNTDLLTVDYTFATPGDYEVTATAKAGSETAEVTKVYCYAGESTQAAYPGGTPKMGPVKNADGSVTFCLGAPEKNSVIIVGEWNDYAVSNDYVMNYTDVNGLRYFWTTIKGLDNNKMYGYYYLIDGDLQVGDPYARLVLDPYNDKYLSTNVFPNLPAYPEDKVQNVPLAIYQGNINDYNWKVKNFKGVEPYNLIIYELLFRDFTGTEGKAAGNGTVKQAIEKIPYLKQLGVNAIELLPINEFNGNISWGYNPNFYFAVDKAYGTPSDYKEFIDICHQNGIAVILDIVFNQSDGLHPWYQMYQPGKNPFYNLNAPHAYSVLNDWNQGFPMVQEQWDDVIRYWMTEYKVDGFRFDLVKGLGNNDSYANNGDAATNAYNASRVKNMKRLHDVMREVNPDAYFINENLAGTQEENEMAADGELNWANLNDAGCQFAMGWPERSGLNGMYAPKNGGRTWGSTVSYLESHDEQRLAYKQNQWGVVGVQGEVGPSMQRLGSSAAQMIMAPGAHMIWQFSELGNDQNTKTDQGNNTDPKIVCWSLLDDPDRKGLYDCYSELIGIRNENPEMFAQSATFDNACMESNWENGRTLSSKANGKEIYTVINPNVNKNITVTINFDKSSDASYKIMSKSYDSNPSFSASAKTVTVPANCYVVIGSDSLNDNADVSTIVDELRVYGSDGSIIVDYSAAGVEIYSLDGRRMGAIEEKGSIEVPAGVYILRSGANSRKIMVK